MTLSDAAIVEQCLAGQKNAFEELVRRYQHVVYNVSLSLMKRRDRADDLAQETFLQAFRKLSRYDARYSFRNWILTICVNQGKNRWRASSRRKRTMEAYAREREGPSGPPTETSPDIVRHLQEIPEKLRVPLVLKHVEGLSYEEVALVLSIGTSAAKMRVKRGRDALMRLLQAETEGGVP
jgi:RNA polymerase sigma-70 factor (ECF subfamily)